MESFKKKKLFLMCGIPGVGKSTWLKNNKNFFTDIDSIDVISRDKIRFALLDEGEDYFSKEDDVWKNYVKEAKRSLKENYITILDATHLSIASRKKILKALGDLSNIDVYAVVCVANLETALKRNREREGLAFVPPSAIRRMYFQFVKPTKEEGFKEIYYIDLEDK